jgi:hypothetical protein
MSPRGFDEDPDLGVLTTSVVLGGAPILMVTHDEDDGGWQFLCGTTNAPEHGRIVHLADIVAMDPTVTELVDLPLGWVAWRAALGAPWIRERRTVPLWRRTRVIVVAGVLALACVAAAVWLLGSERRGVAALPGHGRSLLPPAAGIVLTSEAGAPGRRPAAELRYRSTREHRAVEYLRARCPNLVGDHLAWRGSFLDEKGVEVAVEQGATDVPLVGPRRETLYLVTFIDDSPASLQEIQPGHLTCGAADSASE